MRAAVQGESQLQSMPNNTAIMISFAACVGLELSTTVDGNLAPSVQNLITETADVLERIGSNPPHRNGASALFARQLRHVAQRSRSRKAGETTGEWMSAQANSAPFAQGVHQQQPIRNYTTGQSNTSATPTASDSMVFSGMSNDEIIQAIESASLGLDMSWADLPFGDGANLDWLDWPT